MKLKPLIDPDKLTPTEFASVADKVKFGEALIRFIETGFKSNRWTKPFYRRLCSCFGFIAHHNAHEFWNEYFASTHKQVLFLEHLARYRPVGDPAFTFSDVERMVQAWVSDDGTLRDYNQRLNAEIEKLERAQLERLKAKYEKEL